MYVNFVGIISVTVYYSKWRTEIGSTCKQSTLFPLTREKLNRIIYSNKGTVKDSKKAGDRVIHNKKM
jgi:hypothetical protein